MAGNDLITRSSGRALQRVILKGFRGFTLAEVLITLVIIGVIAAMTIPTLMNNTNKQEYVSRLIKSYSTLSQGLNSIWNNNGTAPGDYEFFTGKNFMDELAKVISVQKKCNNAQDCLGGDISQKYKFLNNTSAVGAVGGKSVITADGQFFSYTNFFDGALSYGMSAEDHENIIGRILVDVNGNKTPNKVGVDTFYFYLVRGKGILPAGIDNYSTCRKTSEGQSCAAKVLKEKTINYI